MEVISVSYIAIIHNFNYIKKIILCQLYKNTTKFWLIFLNYVILWLFSHYQMENIRGMAKGPIVITHPIVINAHKLIT